MADVQAPGDSRSAVVLLGTTASGKAIHLIRRPNCSVRIIHYEGMDKLPPQLEGGFSSVASATHVVESYLAKVKACEIKLDGSESKAKEKKVKK